MTIAITNYGREVAGTLTRRADSSPDWMQCGVVVCVLDLLGGRPVCAFGDGAASPTLTRGRASASDVHAVVIEEN